MHDLGYTVFDLPRLHLSERRVLAEGKRVEGDLREATRQQHSGETETNAEGQKLGRHRYEDMREASKRRAIERYARKHVDGGA